MSLRTYSHQLAALNAKAVKAWLQDASWKGRANKNNPRFYAAAKAIEAASTVLPQRFSLKAVKVEPTGLKATTKANIGNTFALGVKRTAAAKAKMSTARKGKKHTAATKAKMSAAKKGKKRTAATKAKISAAKKGKKLSAATKAKISAARKGNTNMMKKR